MFLSKILKLSCTTKHCIMTENTLVVNVCKAFSTLDRYVIDCFEINNKQITKMSKEGETVTF